jgi:hypothetical protein
MKLESIANFEVNQRVILNPDNHGMSPKKPENYRKIKDRIGRVVKIETVLGDGELIYTGRITVRWDGDYLTRIYSHKNLLIV